MLPPSRWTDPTNLTRNDYPNNYNLSSRISFYSKFGTNPQGWATWVFEQILPHIAGTETCFLDLGSGNGSIWARNRDAIPDRLKLVLSDLSLGMARDLKASNVKSSGVACCDARHIPFANNSFDAVSAFNVLYHLASREPAYEEIQRVLKPSGVFVVTTIAANHLIELRTLISSVDREMGENLIPSLYFLEDAKIELERNFVRVTTLTYQDPLWVTSPKDLIQYLMSTNACRDAKGERLQKLTEVIDKVFSSRSSFQITASLGLVIAHKAL